MLRILTLTSNFVNRTVCANFLPKRSDFSPDALDYLLIIVTLFAHLIPFFIKGISIHYYLNPVRINNYICNVFFSSVVIYFFFLIFCINQ